MLTTFAGSPARSDAQGGEYMTRTSPRTPAATERKEPGAQRRRSGGTRLAITAPKIEQMRSSA